MAPGERAQMELRGLSKRGEVLGAVVVLEGAGRAELQRASALGAMLTDRCILAAVDGGLRTCRAAKRKPDLFVGDGDSLRRAPPTDIPAVLYPQDKAHSDLAGALGELRKRRVKVVVVAGLTGGRVDHEWANLMELGNGSRGFAGIVAPSNRGTVLVTRHGCRAATVRGRTFSLFSLSAASTVTLRGPQWELNRDRLKPGSRGLSNRTGTELDLLVHTGVVALVLLPASRRGARARSPARRRRTL
jgi:thiamine pyrophosphokinase